jgi:hypothetical protein
MHRLFGFSLEEISAELSKVIAYAVTKKSMKELEDERLKLRQAMRSPFLNGTEEETLRIQEGVVCAAILSKKLGG